MTHLIDPQQVERVAVVGAGTIGASWTALFLAHGKTVAVYDPSPDAEPRVRDFIATAWKAMAQLGLPGEADPGRVSFCDSVADAVCDADLVQESGPEDLALKREVYGQMDGAVDEATVIASSSSGLLISDLQAGRVGPERFVLAHPFNPPHLIPLVEICGGKQTAPEVADWAIAFYRGIGKQPVRLHKEVPGHIANRLAAALWREAIHLVVEGVASVKDVDAAVKHGPGLRWACMGPHLIYHLGGGPGGIQHFIDHLGPAFERWWDDLGNPRLTRETAQALAVGIEEEVGATTLPELAAQRDVRLIAVLEALAKSAGDAAVPRTETRP